MSIRFGVTNGDRERSEMGELRTWEIYYEHRSDADGREIFRVWNSVNQSSVEAVYKEAGVRVRVRTYH